VSSEPSIRGARSFPMSWLSRLTPLGQSSIPGAPFVDAKRRSQSSSDVACGERERRQRVKVSGSLDRRRFANRWRPRARDTSRAARPREYLTLDSETHRARFRIDGATTWVSVVERRGPSSKRTSRAAFVMPRILQTTCAVPCLHGGERARNVGYTTCAPARHS